MKVYSWDAGVALGYIVYDNSLPTSFINRVDPVARNCSVFVDKYAKKSKNYLPNNSRSEIKHRMKKHHATFYALFQLVQSNDFTENKDVDKKRVIELQIKILDIKPQEAIKSILKIQSLLYSKWVKLKANCNFKNCIERIARIDENKIRQKFIKEGDLKNFSTTICLHNKVCECTFITTDKNDFQNLNLDEIKQNYKIPSIEFVQDYS